jgi:hypothetical protein
VLVTYNDVVDTGTLDEHVGDQLGRDRSARLVLLVLPRVREVGAVHFAFDMSVQPAGRPRSAGMRRRETYTTAVMRRADAIRRVCAMMHNLRRPGPFRDQLLVCLGEYDGKFLGGGGTDSMSAPLVAVSGELAVATM